MVARKFKVGLHFVSAERCLAPDLVFECSGKILVLVWWPLYLAMQKSFLLLNSGVDARVTRAPETAPNRQADEDVPGAVREFACGLRCAMDQCRLRPGSLPWNPSRKAVVRTMGLVAIHTTGRRIFPCHEGQTRDVTAMTIVLEVFAAMGSTRGDLLQEKEMMHTDRAYYEEWCVLLDLWSDGHHAGDVMSWPFSMLGPQMRDLRRAGEAETALATWVDGLPKGTFRPPSLAEDWSIGTRLYSEWHRAGHSLVVWRQQAASGLPLLPSCGYCGLPTGNYCDRCLGPLCAPCESERNYHVCSGCCPSRDHRGPESSLGKAEESVVDSELTPTEEFTPDKRAQLSAPSRPLANDMHDLSDIEISPTLSFEAVPPAM